MNGSTSSSARCCRLGALVFHFPAYLLLALSSGNAAISGHSILVALGLFDGERRSTREVGWHLHLNATVIQTPRRTLSNSIWFCMSLIAHFPRVRECGKIQKRVVRRRILPKLPVRIRRNTYTSIHCHEADTLFFFFAVVFDNF